MLLEWVFWRRFVDTERFLDKTGGCYNLKHRITSWLLPFYKIVFSMTLLWPHLEICLQRMDFWLLQWNFNILNINILKIMGWSKQLGSPNHVTLWILTPVSQILGYFEGFSWSQWAQYIEVCIIIKTYVNLCEHAQPSPAFLK